MAARIRRTVQGQAWDQLSKAEYGVEKLLCSVLEANPDEADAVLFSRDTPVVIPEAEAPGRNGDLPPPWERL